MGHFSVEARANNNNLKHILAETKSLKKQDESHPSLAVLLTVPICYIICAEMTRLFCELGTPKQGPDKLCTTTSFTNYTAIQLLGLNGQAF